MDITIIQPDSPPPSKYAFAISMTIKSFKGRRDVEVHLFRGDWDRAAENDLNWCKLINSCEPDEGSRRVIMESFTSEERDDIINYLKEQYSTRLTAIRSTPLSFPVPAGLSGLTQMTPGKNLGFIEFDKIPSYPLHLPLKGLYDLSQHPPIAEE